MKWISVKERLPEDNFKMILALTNCCQFPHILLRDHNYKCPCTESAICSNISEEWVFLRDDSGFHYKGDEVKFSHWIPLPERPKNSE